MYYFWIFDPEAEVASSRARSDDATLSTDLPLPGGVRDGIDLDRAHEDGAALSPGFTPSYSQFSTRSEYKLPTTVRPKPVELALQSLSEYMTPSALNPIDMIVLRRKYRRQTVGDRESSGRGRKLHDAWIRVLVRRLHPARAHTNTLILYPVHDKFH